MCGEVWLLLTISDCVHKHCFHAAVSCKRYYRYALLMATAVPVLIGTTSKNTGFLKQPCDRNSCHVFRYSSEEIHAHVLSWLYGVFVMCCAIPQLLYHILFYWFYLTVTSFISADCHSCCCFSIYLLLLLVFVFIGYLSWHLLHSGKIILENKHWWILFFQ